MLAQPQAADLVGRTDELSRLRACVVEVAAGRGRSVWVEGEPGIGKSALLAAALADAPGLGCAVFSALADEIGGPFPLRVLLDGLRVVPGSADDERAAIVAMLQGAGTSAAVTPGDVVGTVAERLMVLVERACAATPVVLVVDDLQWADEASLAVWARLHRLIGQMPLLLVAACRPVPQRAEVAALRRTMSDPDALLIRLGPLRPTDAVDMMGRLLGAAPGPRLRAHADRTGGNPLYLRELVDALMRERLVRVDGDAAELAMEAADEPPVSLAGAIAGRLGFLSEPASTVLRSAAVLGTAFTVTDLAVLTSQPPARLVDVVQEAMAAGVLVESGDRLVFRHGLIREALYGGMPATLRSALHREAAQVLAEAGALVPKVAKHLLAAPDAVDGWVVGWVVDVADVLAHRAPRIAVDLLLRVRTAASPQDPHGELLDAGLATALFLLGRYEEVEPLARPVLATTRDPEVAGRMVWTLAYALRRTGRIEEGVAVTGEALTERALTPVWTARVRALRALLLDAARHPDAEATATRAVVEGERARDRLAVGYALHAVFLTQRDRHRDPAVRLGIIDRALAVIGEEPETTDLRVLLLGNRSVPLDDLGRVTEAARAIGEALALAERAGSPDRLTLIRVQAAANRFRYGWWDEALAELEEAAGNVSVPDTHHRLWVHGLAARIAGHRDDGDAVARHLSAVADIEITGGYTGYYGEHVHLARALLAERGGRPHEAVDLLRGVYDAKWAQDPLARRLSFQYLPDVVRLAFDVGDRPFAESLAEACAAAADEVPLTVREAAAQHCHALMTADPAPALSAAETFGRIGLPLLQAQALENAAVLLAGRGEAVAARAASTAAIEVYTGLGAVWDIRRLNARLREFGIRHGFRGQRGRPSTGWEALTPTELKIAEMIAAGQSNPDIAAELWLSRRTVQSHVSHILAKLGARSRVEIARAAYAKTSAI